MSTFPLNFSYLVLVCGSKAQAVTIDNPIDIVAIVRNMIALSYAFTLEAFMEV